MQHNYIWQGREDGEGLAHQRMYHLINAPHASAEYVFIGFSSDEGVRRNQGRQGAADAPDLIRQQLANLPVHEQVHVMDVGTVVCVNGQLEQAQAELAQVVALQLAQGRKPIVLGGGHEIAFGSFSGLFDDVQQHHPTAKIGILNFDAHFDLRQAEQATSGTPFLQAAKLCQQHQRPFYYMCLGVGKHANTRILFDTADALNCDYLYDFEITMSNLAVVLQRVDGFLAQIDMLYVTIDLDVFNASIAPGVSAPAVKGIDLATFEAIFQHLKASGKIRLLDVAECNPRFDQDHRTAKLAAYLIYQYLFA